ncbi:MAG: hypothetical protein ABSB28_07040 [Candidatus Bathyarchaeia archaeon]
MWNRFVKKVILTLLFMIVLMLVLGFCGYAAGGRVVDVYTQRGGVGPNVNGGDFAVGEQVILNAIATYNGFPVQHVAIAFQVFNPNGGTEALLSALTDENGTARTDFRVPYLPTSEGVWTVVATVDIFSENVSDTVSFRVSLFQVVGGYAFPVQMTNAERPLTLYLTLLVISATVLSLTNRLAFKKTERLRKRAYLHERKG